MSSCIFLLSNLPIKLIAANNVFNNCIGNKTLFNINDQLLFELDLAH